MKPSHPHPEALAIRTCKATSGYCLCAASKTAPGFRLNRRICGIRYRAAIRQIINRTVWGK
jgi:hypothetical protein